ncbi:hypothetical protein; putative signal peptide [Frankia alni ACN14a]|uniref:Uncharacterized protein n=1 Tax=Frankia alni (strain DSM 45986 / CECT 9034 / ACN14a) TaxID=326424 RepID=Q0RN39_FRAAA|nr:hypothetical protein; putative signal peptide [Frankia alni ACN14a]
MSSGPRGAGPTTFFGAATAPVDAPTAPVDAPGAPVDARSAPTDARTAAVAGPADAADAADAPPTSRITAAAIELRNRLIRPPHLPTVTVRI